MNRALAAAKSNLPAERGRSLTLGPRDEMSVHAQFPIDTGLAVYLADIDH